MIEEEQAHERRGQARRQDGNCVRPAYILPVKPELRSGEDVEEQADADCGFRANDEAQDWDRDQRIANREGHRHERREPGCQSDRGVNS